MLAVGLFAGFALANSPAMATTLAALSQDQLVDASTLIVEGTVLTVATWTDDTGRTWTRAAVRVDRALKGAVAKGDVLTVEAPGGVGADGSITFVSLTPRYDEEERVLLYLDPVRHGAAYGTIGLVAGKFTIRQNPADGSDMLVRFTIPVDQPYDARFIPHPPAAERVSLASVESTILSRVATGWDGKPILGFSDDHLRSINKLQPGVK